MSSAVDALLRGIEAGRLSAGDQAAVQVYFKGLDDAAAAVMDTSRPGATGALKVRRLVVDGDLAVPAGNITVGPVAAGVGNIILNTGGLRTRLGTVEKIKLSTLGDVMIGSDLAAPGSTYLSIFSIQQTYNSENFLAGDMLIGDNSANKANIKWDKANGQLIFRKSSTTFAKMTSSGTLTFVNSANALLFEDTGGSVATGGGIDYTGSNALGFTNNKPAGEMQFSVKTTANSTRQMLYREDPAKAERVQLYIPPSTLGCKFTVDSPSATGFEVITDKATSGTIAFMVAQPDAYTGLTAGIETLDVNFILSHNVQHATGAITTQRAFKIDPPTYSFVGASVITTAATLAIAGAPIAGTNATLTNSYALMVDGPVLIDPAALAGGQTMLTLTGAADTAVAAEKIDANLNLARTVTINTSYATQRAVAIQAPTYAGSAATKTITTAVTLDIDNAPQVGANAAITTAYALRVQAGNVALLGGLNVGSATGAATGTVKASLDGTFAGGVNVGTASGSTAGQIRTSADIIVIAADANTGSEVLALSLRHTLTSGNGAAGIGAAMRVDLDDSTTTNVSASYDVVTWVVATHASRTARRIFKVYDATTSRECLRLEASGTAPMVGFYGHAAVAQPAAPVTLADVIAIIRGNGLSA